MDGWRDMDGWDVDGQKNGWIDRCMSGYTDGWINEWTDR